MSKIPQQEITLHNPSASELAAIGHGEYEGLHIYRDGVPANLFIEEHDGNLLIRNIEGGLVAIVDLEQLGDDGQYHPTQPLGLSESTLQKVLAVLPDYL